MSHQCTNTPIYYMLVQAKLKVIGQGCKCYLVYPLNTFELGRPSSDPSTNGILCEHQKF